MIVLVLQEDQPLFTRVFAFDPAADSEDVAVGMADVEFANAPRHVRWRHRDLDVLLDAMTMGGVNVFDPDGHPAAFVGRLPAFLAEGKFVGATAASTLAIMTEKDLGHA